MTVVAIQEKESAQLETSGVPYYVRDDTGASLSQALAVSTAQGAAIVSFGSGGEDFRFKRLSDSVARVSIQYRAGSLSPLTPPSAGSASYTFNFRATARHFVYSEQLIRKVPSDAPDPNGLINIVENGNSFRAEGITVGVPTVTDRITYQFPNAVITQSFRDEMRALFDEGGAVNSDVFLALEPGTMRLVECTSTIRSSGDQTITFGFAYAGNKGRVVGGLNLGTVDGHDIFWTFNKLAILIGPNGKDLLLPEPLFGYVERVLPRINFSLLGLPAV